MFEITTPLVRRLVDAQFPKWKELEIYPVKQSGHDNRTFHLGKEMLLRLPSDYKYVAQIEKEFKWLPFLAKNISLPITCPIALGIPTEEFPVSWAVNQFIEGETVRKYNLFDINRFAVDLAAFLKELQRIETKEGPLPGEHNFYRGLNPAIYQKEVNGTLQMLKKELPVETLKDIWADSVATKWKNPPVWIHGDIAPGNLLVQNGKLSGVIDFGIMGIGDPACDYSMAWTFFDSVSRKIFLKNLDEGTINRARGWALWKALITYHEPNAAVAQNAKETIASIMAEHNRTKK